jgi:hypothetical protein
MKRDISPELARELFNYCPETGQLSWKNPAKKNPAGTRTHYGYLVVQVDRVQVKVHRIVWAMCKGAPGDLFIDHINQNKSDNRISNLRLCTNSQNLANRSVRSKSGKPTGVRYLKRLGKWAARITHEGKEKHLGCFETIEAATQARLNAVARVHGEFAPLEARA